MEKVRLIVSLDSTLSLVLSHLTQYPGLQNESQSCFTDESQHECFSLTSYGGGCSKNKVPPGPLDYSSSSVARVNPSHKTQQSLKETHPCFREIRNRVAQCIMDGKFVKYEQLLKQHESFAMLGHSCNCATHTGFNTARMIISGFTVDNADAALSCLRRIKRVAPHVINQKTSCYKSLDLVEYAKYILPMYRFNLIKNQLSDLVSDKTWTFDNPRKKIKVVPGDITTTKADVIVNVANESLISGVIHKAAGPQLKKEFEPLTSCPPGEVRSTGSHNILCCKRIFHTVRPKDGDSRVLKNCYINCLEQLKKEGFKSIAFCCIGTGVYRFPYKEAAMIAFYTVWDWLNHPENREIEKVTFVCDGKNLEEYQALLGTPHPSNFTGSSTSVVKTYDMQNKRAQLQNS